MTESTGAHDHDPHAQHGHDHDHDHDQGNCEEALAELYTFLDGELTETKRSKIKHHLDDCSPCLEAFDFEAELRTVIRHRCQDEVPEHLRMQVAAKLAAFDLTMGRPLGDTASDPLGGA